MGLVVLAVIVLFKRFQSSAAGGRKLDEWRMKLPVFGKVIQINLFGQFARTLGTLLQNGVPVLTALKITEQVMSNQLIKRGHRQDARGGDGRQDARAAAGAEQTVPATDD